MSNDEPRKASSLLVDYLTISLFVLSAVGLAVGRLTDNDTIAFIAVGTWTFSIVFAVTRVSLWTRRTRSSLAALIAEDIKLQRSERGGVDSATDPRVRNIWSTWNALIESEIAQPTDVSFEFQGWGLETRQIALQELSHLVADNPHTTIHEWLRHLDMMVDGAKADDEEPLSGAVAQAWDDRLREIREWAV